MKLSENLKIIRKENNLSQEQLAEQLGVSRQAVSKWESDQSYPEMDKVLLICKLYGYGIDELMNENVSVVKEERQSKNNVNKYIEDFFAFITKSVEMFNSMKLRQRLKCLFEMCCIVLFLVCIFAIIGAVGGYACALMFGRMPYEAYEIYMDIVKAIYIILFFVVGTAVLLHIFKIRYLDYYKIVKEEDISDNLKNKIDNSNNENNTSDVSKKKKIFIKDKQEKIIIRDPDHTQSKFLTGILKCVLTCIKALAVLVGIYFSITFVVLVTLIILSFLFVKAGLVFFGALFVLSAALLLNFIILKILYYFIISKKNNKKTIGIIIISALVLIGIGVGAILGGLTQFEYVNVNKITDEYTFEMTDKLLIWNKYFDIEYVENNLDNITIRFERPEFYSTNCYMINDETYKYDKIHFDCYEDNTKKIQAIRSLIADIKNKTLRNYERTKIYVYTSKENQEKIKQNKIEYDKKVKEKVEEYNRAHSSGGSGTLLLNEDIW